ncbi:MAG TPA: HAD-IIA family hydrolase [Anaerolineaceae bacterium]|jgi:NagD protein
MDPKNYLIDMDGVLVHGNRPVAGANEFIDQLKARGRKFLILTNNPMYTPGDLCHRLQSIGLDVQKEQIFTSALATAHFLETQFPNGKAFVIGESGLTEAIHNVGYIITETEPDYMVLGETFSYNFDRITKAIRHVAEGARFIATNPDPTGPSESGIVPACGAMAALIEKATGKNAFFIGKPNPFMMRAALNYLGVHSENTVMIGDRMDTDVLAGIQSGMETILVLSGVTRREQVPDFPYQPKYIYDSVANIEP